MVPLLMSGAKLATIKTGIAALSGGRIAPGSKMWAGIDELKIITEQAKADAISEGRGQYQGLTTDLASAGLSIAKNVIGEEIWNSLIPTVRYAVDFADTATATANEQVKAKLGEAEDDAEDDAEAAAAGASASAALAGVRTGLTAAEGKLGALRDQQEALAAAVAEADAARQAAATAEAEAERLRVELAQLKEDLEAERAANAV